MKNVCRLYMRFTSFKITVPLKINEFRNFIQEDTMNILVTLQKLFEKMMTVGLYICFKAYLVERKSKET